MSKRIGFSIGIVGLLLSLAVIGWVSIGLAQSGSTITSYSFQPAKTSKSVTLSNFWQGITVIRVTGMQDADLLNIRPIKESKASASAINVVDSTITVPDGRQMSLPQNGQAVDASALVVNESLITFSRPNITGKILLDVELPDSSEIQVYFNNTLVLKNSSLYSPVSVRAGEIYAGYEFTGKALNRVMFPELIELNDSKPADRVEKVAGENLVLVPFSKLQVKSSVPLPENSSPFRVLLDINEQGIVERAVAQNASNAQEIEQIMRQWQFVPYSYNGTPVKVKTVFIKD